MKKLVPITFMVILTLTLTFAGCGGGNGTTPPHTPNDDQISGFVYVTNGLNNISGYTINTTTGKLQEIGGSPFTTDSGPIAVTADPNGKFIYVANKNNSISAYTINATTGALSPILGSPFPVGTGLISVTVDSTGKYLYVANSGDGINPGEISAYTIDSTTGALATMSGSPFSAGIYPFLVVVDPLGRYVYAANLLGNNISAYTINSGGVLAPVTGSPFSAGTKPVSVAVDPTGKFVYVANLNSNNILAYTINSSSSELLSPIISSSFLDISNFVSVIVHPTGQFVYALNQDPTGESSGISVYTINSGGVLSPVTGSHLKTASDPCLAAIDPNGNFIYVTNSYGISIYRINSTSGTLTAISGGALVSNPSSIITVKKK
jgi:6-phosphogluconolactonase